MCTNPDPPWPAWDGSFDYSYTALVKRIKEVEQEIKQDDSIYLTGGEPTMHPCFFELLQFLANSFPKQRIKLLTNGRRFAYEDFTTQLINTADNLEILVSLCGADEKSHDSVTRSEGSFQQTSNGIKNLLSKKNSKQQLEVRFVITKQTYKQLQELLKYLRDNFPVIDRVVLIFWEAEAQAVKNLDKVKVTYKQVIPYLEKGFPLFNQFKELRLYHFPLCTIEKRFWPFVWDTLPEHEVTFLNRCEGCKVKNKCMGIQKSYLEYNGGDEFIPIKKTQ
jgi:sulfatase maturation enzyme AslB (radical SAM superfamily)